MPRKRVTQSPAMITSVAAALRASGALNAGTPLETASTPVIAVQPLANARSTRNVERPRMASGAGRGAWAGTPTVK